jgi:hypothetical protein
MIYSDRNINLLTKYTMKICMTSYVSAYNNRTKFELNQLQFTKHTTLYYTTPKKNKAIPVTGRGGP